MISESSRRSSGLSLSARFSHFSRYVSRCVLDLLYPRSCLVSGEPVGSSEGDWLYLGQPAVEKLNFVHPPHCRTCGYPYSLDAIVGERCKYCSRLEPEFSEGKTCLLIHGTGRVLVHTLKYHHGAYLKKDIQRIVEVIPGVAEFIEGAVLVPVPLHARRQRERGFNQSDYLAKWFAQKALGAQVEDLLDRVVDTVSQTELNYEQRQKNMENAFRIKPGVVLRPRKRYVIIDDVFTTGATVNACAQALRLEGALNVDVLTLTHG